ncbi:MAG TPA: glycosyl hydrolase [Casimicrobiaceae bacterium]|nr:glycosyl hydrolase [Casimicrobiaceae bacterium]
MPRTKVTARSTPARRIRLLIATRKGLWTLTSDVASNGWTLAGPQFLGHIVHHAICDPRDGKTLLAAARTGHLGPTVFRSTDAGRNWKEATRPPAFAEGSGRVVDHTFWLTPGHASEPGVWYAGTSPQGLFRSADAGATWEGVAGFNAHPQRKAWCGDDQDGTPDGAKLHSILIDPRDRAHMYVGMSSGGVFESVDGGADWRPLNKGVRADFIPAPAPEFGHDPHCVRFAGANPDRLYQQNHCGIYRIDRPSDTWQDIGASMPKSVGDVGFPLAVHPRDPDSVWVFPMDGTSVWPRTAPGGRPAAYRSRDGGKSWKRQDQGLPKSQAWWTVKRQAMTNDLRDPMGLYFGTTSGEIWGTRDEGRTFRCLARHLPHIYALEAW